MAVFYKYKISRRRFAKSVKDKTDKMAMNEDFLQQKLEERRAQNALRELPAARNLVDFCSNDYLGFARSMAGVSAASGGATGSRLISGNSDLAEQLEQQIADFHHAPSGLIFNAGYVANIGLLSCIASRHDTILYDQLVHASIREGIRLSQSKSYSFLHNDIADLQKKIQRASGRIFIVVESIYSMDGDEAPLRQICQIAAENNAYLIVDEAHSNGVFGENGEGLVVEQNLQAQVWARIHTFGKAIGSHGAIVLGSSILRQYLINFSRAFIYTTALPLHTLQAIQIAYEQLPNNLSISRTHQNISLFKKQLSVQYKSYFVESRSPIQCLIWAGNDRVKAFARAVQAAGFDVRPILHPTVPMGEERLRICLHAFNSEQDISELAKTINLYLAKYA